MSIIGIDLGTTNCVVSVPSLLSGKGFLPNHSLNCTVITDRLGRQCIPAVVAEDEDNRIVVGYEAKAMVGMAPVIMFAKRFMGKDETFPLGQRGPFRPEEVSAEILKYIKSVAEQQLQEKVTEAVITVPAYFGQPAKQKTVEAGKKANLTVTQLLQEPVAAAYMYCLNDPRDQLRVMTYDLGGGTFDVAVVEKRGGIISSDSILAFDGDCYMGGYNFDKHLANWMINELKALGYDLDLKPDKNHADAVIHAKLMILAERIKIELSRTDVVNVRESTLGIKDHAGNSVVINLDITREIFAGLIAKDIANTIKICMDCLWDLGKREELKRNPEFQEESDESINRLHKTRIMTDVIKSLDEIILVGGSTRIPLVKKKLKDTFNKVPKLVDPDLCVGLGAALAAKSQGSTKGQFKLDNIPETTDLPSLTITGRLLPSAAVPDIRGCRVELRSLDQSYAKQRTIEGEAGGFVFNDVPLACESTTSFRLTAIYQGQKLSCHEFSIRQSFDIEGPGHAPPPPDVLAKPISILTASGRVELLTARTPLPAIVENFHAEKYRATNQIRIPILEGDNEIGELLMRHIPTSLPAGSEVLITLSVKEDFQICAKAYVPSIARDEEIVIQIPIPPIKTLDELRRDFELVSEQADLALNAVAPGAKFGDPTVNRLDERVVQCREMLEEPFPDLPRIQDCLGEITTLTRRLEAGWRPNPSRIEFEKKAVKAEKLVKRLESEQPETVRDGWSDRLVALRDEAREAYGHQNDDAWKSSWRELQKLYDHVEYILDDTGKPDKTPAQVLVELTTALQNLKQQADDLKRLEGFENDFKKAGETLKTIDSRAHDVWERIRDWYNTQYLPLYDKLLRSGKDIDLVDIPKIGQGGFGHV